MGFQKILNQFLVVICCSMLFLPLTVARAEETPAQRDERMAWWREARFGMFIHWGLYAIPAGVWKGNPVDHAGEWIMFTAKIPVPEYEPLIKQFNPVQYDPAEWVRIAKAAGMKYIVITSKHHDGFCLFDSKLTDYDVMSTPYGKDLLKPLAEEAHKAGLKICWYHSILDWHHPDYLPRGEGNSRPWDTRPKEGADLNRYLDYMNGQLKELLTNYGDIGIVWFDGGWEHTPEELKSEEVVEKIRSIQPNTIINNRIQIPQDYDTPEQYIPATGIEGRDWEVCMTMNDTWGYKVNDHNWKSREDLIRKLVDIASKGGNFLLNVGPTAEGLIPQPSIERLAGMGEWMDANGESIYGTQASPFRQLEWGRCTRKPGKLYLHVFECPHNEIVVPGLRNEIKAAYLLSDKSKSPLHFNRQGEDVILQVSGITPDTIDKVIVLEIEGEPDVDNTIRPLADGSIDLAAAFASLHGKSAEYESDKRKNCIGKWTNAEDWVSWEMRVAQPGNYRVQAEYACPDDSAGSQVAFGVGQNQVAGTVEKTGSWEKFETREIGSIQVDSTQPVQFEVCVKSMPGGAVMNLRSVKLVPVK